MDGTDVRKDSSDTICSPIKDGRGIIINCLGFHFNLFILSISGCKLLDLTSYCNGFKTNY